MSGPLCLQSATLDGSIFLSAICVKCGSGRNFVYANLACVSLIAGRSRTGSAMRDGRFATARCPHR